MEYRRKTKGRRPKRRIRANRGSGSGGSILITLLLIAGIVYIIVTSNAGEWVAREVMAPLFSAVSRLGEKDKSGDDEPKATYEPRQEGINLSQSDNTETQSAKAVLPAMRCYMLQMGVFSSRENASKEAERLKKLGAAGYIISDASTGETRYRVMASGYETEQSAKSVKDRLTKEGVETALYTISTPEASFKVTAEKETVELICSAFDAFSQAEKALCEGVIEYDKNSMSVYDGQMLSRGILNGMEEKMSPISQYSNEQGTLGDILKTYSECRDQLLRLCDSSYESRVDFSSAMKYTHLYIADRYAAMMDKLAK